MAPNLILSSDLISETRASFFHKYEDVKAYKRTRVYVAINVNKVLIIAELCTINNPCFPRSFFFK